MCTDVWEGHAQRDVRRETYAEGRARAKFEVWAETESAAGDGPQDHAGFRSESVIPSPSFSAAKGLH